MSVIKHRIIFFKMLQQYSHHNIFIAITTDFSEFLTYEKPFFSSNPLQNQTRLHGWVIQKVLNVSLNGADFNYSFTHLKKP